MGRRELRNKKKSRMTKITIIIIAAIGLLIVSGLMWYNMSIMPVNKNDDSKVEVVIPYGTGMKSVGKILKENDIIKSELAFNIYAKVNNVSDLQAGTYDLKRSMGLKDITDTLKTGKVYDPEQINITYIEGKNINWLAKLIEEKTNNTKEDVYNLLKDEEYIDSLIAKYWFLDNVIKNSDIYYPLEGYLFPDTYTLKNEDATVKEIFEVMLDQTGKILSGYKQDIENSKYSVHEILSIASMIETEARNDEGRSGVSSVIYNRLELGMALQIDATTYYAFKVEIGERNLYMKELNTYNPYNTRGPNMEGKLPVGPISSVGKASIEAAVYPDDTDYLFYASDKNFKIYFSKTYSEHSKIVSELESQGLWHQYD